MSSRRALYVSYDGLLEPLGESQVVPVVEGLAARGHAMSILSFEKGADLRDRARVEAMERRLGDAGIRWLRHRYHARPSLGATAWDVAVGARAIRREVRTGCGIVHARSYVAGLMGLRGLRGTEARLIADLRGFWIDERIEAGRWRDGSVAVRLARRVERRLFVEADHLVHLTHAAAEAVHRLVPDARLPPHTVIPTCVDLRRFEPADDAIDARRRLGLPAGPVVIHTGTLSTRYLARETLVFGDILARRLEGSFVVLTPEVRETRQMATQCHCAARISFVPHHEVPRWLCAADVGLALVRPGFSRNAMAPTKVGEYLAAGLAVVATRGVGDLETQFADSPVAFALDAEELDDRALPRVVEAARRPDRRTLARELAARFYDLDRAVDAYGEIYRGLGAER